MSKRIKFFIGHLSVSLILALLVVGLVFFVWYPAPLAKAVGVTHIFLMMLIIDVILGPFLGFLVYKEGKKTLKMDLSVIILIQALALGYGVYSIAEGRPVWLVYAIDRFELIKNNELVDINIQDALPQYKEKLWFQPRYVAIKLEVDSDKRSQEMFEEVFGGISLAQRPENYVPLSSVSVQMQERTRELEQLQQYNDEKLVQEILDKYPAADAFVPLKANAVDMTVLINKDKGEVVKIVDLRPWK
ncbi:TfpX/TfpZ family type IV pilin accessory protein [Acinetobacter johnsonii]|uniref:TfpX/TfpZ family type IV pilin accessory protein n=1 Tax=Acinetobacter johnsonii TaxID=40214 RepID=UPI001F460CF0|nr:TfpX/TfpZ family type IV pilin accessory protein [Acinetobacter johnsonii]UJA02411.1 type IV pilin accessory protein [Acinetobacter johnsonii]